MSSGITIESVLCFDLKIGDFVKVTKDDNAYFRVVAVSDAGWITLKRDFVSTNNQEVRMLPGKTSVFKVVGEVYHPDLDKKDDSEYLKEVDNDNFNTLD